MIALENSLFELACVCAAHIVGQTGVDLASAKAYELATHHQVMPHVLSGQCIR